MNDDLRLQSKVLVHESSEVAVNILRSYFSSKGLLALRDNTIGLVALLEQNTDLGAVFLSDCEFDTDTTKVAKEINLRRPDLPIFIRKEKLTDSDVNSNQCYEVYSLDDLVRLDSLLAENLFSRYYPIQLVRDIQELSKDSIAQCIHHASVRCMTPLLIKDNIIYGELFSLIPLESHWCRGYMMLEGTKLDLEKLTSLRRRQLVAEEQSSINPNDLLNEITNLTWGRLKSKLQNQDAEVKNYNCFQVPILVNQRENYIYFGTKEPHLSLRYLIENAEGKCISLSQKLVFNLDWRPEIFESSEKVVSVLVDSGELELF